MGIKAYFRRGLGCHDHLGPWVVACVVRRWFDNDGAHVTACGANVIKTLTVTNEELRVTVGQAKIEFFPFAPTIEGDNNSAGLEDSRKGNEPLGAIAHGDGDARTGRYTELVNHIGGEGIGRLPKVVEGECLIGVLHKKRVTK